MKYSMLVLVTSIIVLRLFASRSEAFQGFFLYDCHFATGKLDNGYCLFEDLDSRVVTIIFFLNLVFEYESCCKQFFVNCSDKWTC